MWYLYNSCKSNLKSTSLGVPDGIPERWHDMYESLKEFKEKPKDPEAPGTNDCSVDFFFHPSCPSLGGKVNISEVNFSLILPFKVI